MNWTRLARLAPGPRRLAGALLLLAAVLAGLVSCTGDGTTLDPFGAPLGPPEARVSPVRIDLSLIEGTDALVEIAVANEGGLPLRVGDVTSTSPFVTLSFDGPREVASGAVATLSARVSAVSADASPQDGSIDVTTNDPRNPTVSLPVHVIVTAGPQPEIEVVPDSVTVRLAPDGSDARTLTIRNTGTGDLHVTDITGSSFVTPGITTATVAPGASVDVVVTADATGLTAGSYDGAVEITSDDADEAQLSIPVTLSVESPFPATLSAIQENVFAPRCATEGCHGGVFPMVGLALTSADSSYASMVGALGAGVASIEVPSLKLVKPGDAANSYLVVKIVPADPRRVAQVMPATGPALATDVIDVIRRWINEGAQRN